VQGHLSTAADILVLILLLRFFVTFPKPKAVSGSRPAAWLVFGTWGCFVAFLVVELITHPALYYTTGSVAGPLTLAYGVLILAAITHTLLKGSGADLRKYGMHWIVGGFLVAILGTALVSFLPVNTPAWAPAILIAAIPISMTLAVRKFARGLVIKSAHA
jgi:hypothetical protein